MNDNDYTVTVGSLRKILENLPNDLPVSVWMNQDWNNPEYLAECIFLCDGEMGQRLLVISSCPCEGPLGKSVQVLITTKKE